MSEEKAAETPLADHVLHAIELMEQGARMRLGDIPNDPSRLSSSFSADVTKVIAKQLRLLMSEDAVTFGDGRTHDWRRCPCTSCTYFRDAQTT